MSDAELTVRHVLVAAFLFAMLLRLLFARRERPAPEDHIEPPPVVLEPLAEAAPLRREARPMRRPEMPAPRAEGGSDLRAAIIAMEILGPPKALANE